MKPKSFENQPVRDKSFRSRWSRIEPYLFDIRSNRERQKAQTDTTAQMALTPGHFGVAPPSSAVMPAEPKPGITRAGTLRQFESEFDTLFNQQYDLMERELDAPFVRQSRGSEIMKTKFDEAIARGLNEHDLVLRGIASVTSSAGVTLEELVQEAEALGLEPQAVVHQVLFREDT